MANRLSMRTFGSAQCGECSSQFTKFSPRAVYCGGACKIVARRRNARRRLADHRRATPIKVHDRNCRRCDFGFTTTDPYNYYCQQCILAAATSGRSKYQFLSRKAETIPSVRECGGCKGEFAPEWVTQKYCGPSCKVRARRSTPEGLLNARMNSAVNRALAGGKGGRAWVRLVGYSAEELRKHIERQFTAGMNWKDAGAFHIDHITPLSSFSFDSAEHPEFRAAWALTNLRPMWATDNIRKGAKRTLLL